MQNKLRSLIDKARKAGADAVDAFWLSSLSHSVDVRFGKQEKIKRAENEALALRVLINQQQAMVSTSDLQDNALDELITRAIAMAKIAPQDPHLHFSSSAQWPDVIPSLDVCDPHEPDTATLVSRASEAEEAALANQQISNSEGGSASHSRLHLALATSEGFFQEYHATSSSTSVTAIAEQNGMMERDYDFTLARHAEDLVSPQIIGENAAIRTVKRLGARKAPKGSFPVIFDQREARDLISTFLSAINGASIARGTSFLLDHLGKPVFSKDITIEDNPLIPRGLSSHPFDAEGLRNDALTLVEHGVLQHYLLDLRTSSQLGLPANGRASRGLTSAPSPASSNVRVAKGDTSVDALISSIDQGLLVTETFGNGINIITGDYSQGASGFWIEKGEIAYPVNEITIAGHLKDIFAHLVPANDVTTAFSINSPSLFVPKMVVA